MVLQIAQKSRPASALSAAINMLAQHEPFSKMPLGPMVKTVQGAIARGHYVFAVEDGKIRGFGSWALTTEDVARRWMEGLAHPSELSGAEGDVVALMLSVGDHPEAPALAMRHVAALYPGMRYTYPRTGRRVAMGRFPRRKAGEAGPDAPAAAPLADES